MYIYVHRGFLGVRKSIEVQTKKENSNMGISWQKWGVKGSLRISLHAF